MATFVLLLFILLIVVAVITSTTIIAPLIGGFILFFLYGLKRGFGVMELLNIAWEGVKKLGMLMTIMIVIGMLTASWRASGTVAYLVTALSSSMTPVWALVVAFLSNAIVSTLLGSSFGASATMGVISMTGAVACGVDPWLAGGASLAGVYVGDRCSPLCSSGMIVATFAEVNFYDYLKSLVPSGLLAMAVSAIIYAAIGFVLYGEGSAAATVDFRTVFSREFDLNWVCVIPAVLVMGAACFRLGILWLLGIGTACASVIALTVQGMSVQALIDTLIYGAQMKDSEVARFMNGGGILSMTDVIIIMFITGTFPGLLKATELLEGVKSNLVTLSRYIGVFPSACVTALVGTSIFCNQVLAIIVVNELFRNQIPDKNFRALVIGNSSIVIAGLIPWAISCAVPLASMGAPNSSVFAAVFLYGLPLIFTFFPSVRALTKIVKI